MLAISVPGLLLVLIIAGAAYALGVDRGRSQSAYLLPLDDTDSRDRHPTAAGRRWSL